MIDSPRALDVDALMGELTIAEKASLTSGSGFWHTQPVERLGIPKIMVADGPHGLRVQASAEGDHSGLGASQPATCFPTASAVASSWNPQLLREIGVALAREARAANLSVILGPGINMKRSPLCGRNFEYFSEDPFLAGELAVGIVEGIQSQDVGACVKHFAANNQETDRLRVDARIDERTLREIYLPAFERVIRSARPWTVMCSYNKVNGLSASENPWLLTQVLREEWGFDGLVMSDWGAVYHRVPAAAAGLDLEMPPNLPRSPEQIVAAVRSGELPEKVLDDRARAVLELVRRGAPLLDLEEDFDADAHHRLARTAATESIVLLKNDNGLLPLARESRVAVIGEFARTPRYQGAGSSRVNPTRVDTALDELTATFADVTFAAGYGIEDTGTDDTLRAEAVDAARAADTVVMLIGLPAADESEGYDRTHMAIPANQIAALEAVAAANPNVAVVLVNGSTILLDGVVPHAGALVEAWLGGQAAAGAIADVLSGAVNPSGRLAESFPHRMEDNSSYLNFPGDSQVVRYGEGLFIGYRGYDKAGAGVTFPFGFGLSYTTFDLSGLAVTTSGSAAAGDLTAEVAVTVTNTGPVAGAEVVQVYVRDVESSVTRPVRELKGFAKVSLDPGQSQQVRITLDQRAFSFWSDVHGRWIVEAGEFAIEIGRNSRDIALSRTITVDAPSIAPPLTVESTLGEWLDDPIAAELIEEAVTAGATNPTRDKTKLYSMRSMPLLTLTAFGTRSLDHATVMTVWERYQKRTSSAS